MKHRNPEYDKRDKLFAKDCASCAKASRCTFRTSLEGPEAVCEQLIVHGTYNCESCIRRGKHGGCKFSCVFFISV